MPIAAPDELAKAILECVEHGARIINLSAAMAQLPSLAVEKEFAQATGRAETAGLTDRQALHTDVTEKHFVREDFPL